MRHRFLALVVTLAFAGSLPGPFPVGTRTACARCAGASRCCCARAHGAEGCELARPCAAAGEEGVPASQDLSKALPEPTVVASAPAPAIDFVQPDAPSRPRALATAPPDPPPRLFV